MTPEQIQNLRNAVRATREAPYFNMCFFVAGPYEKTNLGIECRTPGCIIGNYAARQDLQTLFYINDDNDICLRVEPYPLEPHGVRAHLLFFENPKFLEHFGISFDEAYELFSGRGCDRAGKDAVKAANYIEDFITRKLEQQKASETQPGA